MVVDSHRISRAQAGSVLALFVAFLLFSLPVPRVQGNDITWSELPGHLLKPPCRSTAEPMASRIVPIYSYNLRNAEKEQRLKETMEYINWTISSEALHASDGSVELQAAFECDSNGDVAIKQLALSLSTSEEGIQQATKIRIPLYERFGSPQGNGKAVKYLVNRIGNVTGGGVASTIGGQEKSTENRIDTYTADGICFGARSLGPDSCLLHELMHTLGAVHFEAPSTDGSGHTTEANDIMAGGESQASSNCPRSQTEAEGRFWILDCGNNDYFDPIAEPGEYLSTHWNAGEPENVFFLRKQWRTKSSPNPTDYTESSLATVSCSGSSCVSVGPDANTQKTLVEGKDGAGGWQLNASVSGEMKAISCATATWCLGVGTEGKTWKIESQTVGESVQRTVTSLATAAPVGATSVKLNDVSCTSTTACTAVGSYLPSGSSTRQTLAERWNGTSWSQQSTPAPTGEAAFAMKSVSCPTSTWCAAAGYAGGKPVAMRWSSSTWTVMGPLVPAEEASFQDISCPVALTCVAVGGKGSIFYPKSFSERYENGTWTVLTHPTPASGWNESSGPLRGVSCPTTSLCFAAGSYVSLEGEQGWMKTLAETWTGGSSWSIQTSANPQPTVNAFEGIACTSSTACTAVGFSRLRNNEGTVTLAESLSGSSWVAQTTPDQPPRQEHGIDAMSCPNSEMCVAIGGDPYTGKSFVEWQEDDGPWQMNLGGAFGDMNSLSCPSTILCIAVGENGQTWKLKWKEEGGAFKWAIGGGGTASPTGAASVSLKGVSCSSETACTAVGSYDLSGMKTLAYHWNGTSWTQQTTPQPTSGSATNAMQAVSCPSSTSCTAVGNAGGTPFAARWNGTAWSLSSAANPSGAVEASLDAISCPTIELCMAAGNFRTSTGSAKALSERWDLAPSAAWTAMNVPSPSDAQGAVRLNAISCPSATACSASGTYLAQAEGAEEKPLGAKWSTYSGFQWAVEAVPNPTAYSGLNAISCTTKICAAGGASRPGSGSEGTATLTQRWNLE